MQVSGDQQLKLNYPYWLLTLHARLTASMHRLTHRYEYGCVLAVTRVWRRPFHTWCTHRGVCVSGCASWAHPDCCTLWDSVCSGRPLWGLCWRLLQRWWWSAGWRCSAWADGEKERPGCCRSCRSGRTGSGRRGLGWEGRTYGSRPPLRCCWSWTESSGPEAQEERGCWVTPLWRKGVRHWRSTRARRDSCAPQNHLLWWRSHPEESIVGRQHSVGLGERKDARLDGCWTRLFDFEAILFCFYTFWFIKNTLYLWPWSTNAAISRTGIFVAIANNTLYGSKWSIFLLCQTSLGH